MHPEKPRFTDRILRFFVRLFPFDFRADHGREIEQTFHAQAREAAREGKAGLWRLWAEFVAGIFQTAPREHLSILRQDATYALRRMRQNPGFSAVIVLALSVSQRTHEIGIRMALGATPADVNGMILRQGMKLVLVGMALGVAGSAALTRAMSGLLFGVEPGDPLTFVSVSALLIFVAAVACLIPARRAASIEPMLALRTE